MLYRQSASPLRPPADDTHVDYARACITHRRRAVAASLAFFAVVVTAVFVIPSLVPSHRPTMDGTR